MALIPIMAARITTSTLGGTMSARALMKATPAMTNKNNTKALTAPFCQRENEVTTQDKQLSRGVHTFIGKPSNNFLSMKEFRPSTMATRHLILVCHACEENPDGLTFIDREQASLAGRRLFEMDIPVTKIVHNGYRRAAETTNMIASYLPDTPREVDISLTNKQQESVEEALKKYLLVDPVKQAGDSYDLVVCDEDMIKRLISRVMNLKSMEQVPKFKLHHASVSELAVHPDGQVSVRALDDTVCLNPAP